MESGPPSLLISQTREELPPSPRLRRTCRRAPAAGPDKSPDSGRGGYGAGGEFRNSKCGNWKLESVKVRMWECGNVVWGLSVSIG